MDTTRTIKCTVLFCVVMIGSFTSVTADCSTAAADLSEIESEMKSHEQSGDLCSHFQSLADRILRYDDCTDQFVKGFTAELWNKLITDCPDSIKETDTANPLQCRKERCMITPGTESNVTQPDGGNIDFGDVPSNILKRLLDAFGSKEMNAGQRKKRLATSSMGPKTLFDDDLKAIGNLIVDDPSQLQNFDPISVCEILDELDMKKMLECIIDQKTVLKCDGAAIDTEGYDVNENAKKLRDICSKDCIDIPPQPYRLCQSQKPYPSYLQAIQDAATIGDQVDQACGAIQEKYFNCLTDASRCCEPLTNELHTHYSSFMEQQYGGQTCTNIKLNKMIDCDELIGTTAAPEDNDNDDTDNDGSDDETNQNNSVGDPKVAPASDGSGATGKEISLWMVLVLAVRCATLFQS